MTLHGRVAFTSSLFGYSICSQYLFWPLPFIVRWFHVGKLFTHNIGIFQKLVDRLFEVPAPWNTVFDGFVNLFLKHDISETGFWETFLPDWGGSPYKRSSCLLTCWRLLIWSSVAFKAKLRWIMSISSVPSRAQASVSASVVRIGPRFWSFLLTFYFYLKFARKHTFRSQGCHLPRNYNQAQLRKYKTFNLAPIRVTI